MNCPHCQHANPDGAKFCMNCGKSFAIKCPTCGTEVPAGAKFCFNCGHQLALSQASPPAPAQVPAATLAQAPLQQYIPEAVAAKLDVARQSRAMEGERRIITILFSDVKGSTAMAGQLDPEEWTEIMNGAFEYLIAPVYRYEGVVARLMGDAILAFFGAPIAHEDDPQRAVLAGLEIVSGIQEYRAQVRRQYGMDFNLRVGINTGLVVVGAVGSDMRMEYTAMGDAINLAARMEQSAQPGTVQLAEETYRLVAPLFEVEALGEIEVKGKAERVRAYRALRPKAQPGRLRGIEGLDAPLIGRQREVEMLRRLVDGLCQGSGHIVSVMGEAGLGKSRLLAELRETLHAAGQLSITGGDEQQAPMGWLEGRSLSYQTSTPYALFANLLGNALVLPSGQANGDAYGDIKKQIAAILTGRTDDVAPFIATLLDIRPSHEDAERIRYLEPPQLRGRVFWAVHTVIQGLARNRPLVLVLDDVHWIDPSSLDLLESLLPLTDSTMLMLVALFRPHRQEPSWRFHETAGRDYAHRYTALALNPLDAEESRALVANLLHVEDLPERVRALILEKAEGNPFFVEEVIRSLLDAKLVVRENSHWRATRDIENITVPNTLVGVITARLDRLDEEAKQAAQTAAVIGREFGWEPLAAVHERPQTLDQALLELQRRELTREKSRLPQRVYAFKHVLTQETVYATLLLSRRRELHRRVAEYLEAHERERAGDIARHFLEARQPERALPHLVEAADRAAHAYATQEAIELYTRALEILDTVEDLPMARRVYQGLGGALTLANEIPHALEMYQTMLARAQHYQDVPMQIAALNKLAFVTGLRLGQFQEAEAYLNTADKMAREYEDKMGLSELSMVRCMMCTAVADFENLVRYMDETVELGREMGVKEQMALGLEHIANSQMFMTQFDEAWRTAQEALRLTREIGNREHEAMLLTSTVPMCHLRNADLDRACRTAEEGLHIADRIGVLIAQVYGAWVLGEIARWRGQYEQAIAYHQRSLQTATPVEAFMPFLVVQPLGALGSTYLELGEHFAERVKAYHLRALKLLDNPAGAMGGGTAWADLGFCALALGDVELADGLFQKGLRYPTMFMRLERPRYLVGVALAALTRGQLDEAARSVEEARAFVDSRAMQYLYPPVAMAEGRVAAARGNMARALGRFAEAEKRALTMTMRPTVWQARAQAAAILDSLGRAEEAEAKRRGARATIEEIAALFRDEGLRAQFVEEAMGKVKAPT